MAITKEEAVQIAQRTLSEQSGTHELVVIEDSVVEKEFGWVFMSSTREFLDTGDPNKAMPGLGPLVVTMDGSTEFIGTSGPPQAGIDIYERKWRERQ